jgi:hypothetical protein
MSFNGTNYGEPVVFMRIYIHDFRVCSCWRRPRCLCGSYPAHGTVPFCDPSKAAKDAAKVVEAAANR